MDDNAAQTDISSILRTSQTTGSNSTDFTIQVANYFGSYVSGALSSDGLPLRSYDDTYRSGIVRKIPLELYPQLHKNIYKNFVTGLGQQTFVIAQNKYISRQDEHVLQSMRANVLNISWKNLAPLLQALASQAETKRIDVDINRSDVIDELLVISRQTLAEDFVIPYLLPVQEVTHSSDKHIRRTLAYLREGVTSRVFDTSRELLRHIYAAYFSSETYIAKDTLIATLADAITPEFLKDSLAGYLDHLDIDDAYQHIYGLHRSTMIDDSQNIYVYFGELTYDSRSFPLFYTQVASSHTFPSITLTFGSRIFVNRQAIEYVIRQFTTRISQSVDLTHVKIPDVIQADDIETLQQLMTSLAQTLKLPDVIVLNKTTPQESTNRFVTLTNKLYFYVDSAYHSAVADDYAAIVGNSDLRKKVSGFLSDLLIKPTTRFVEELGEAWDEMDPAEKLLPVIPLSINDEQKRVLLALGRAAGERIVVDSPYSTGKKHLVNAVVISALSKGESVLVVGSGTSTNHVQHDIAAILEETSGKLGHNPVLNLQETEKLEQNDDHIADIAVSVNAIEGKLSDLATAKKHKKQALKDGLTQFIQSAESINLHEVEQSTQNEKRFAGKTWIEDEPIDAISTSIQQLHRAIQYVRSSEAGYLMPYTEVEKQTAIENFLVAYLEYEKANKTVQTRLPDFIVRYKKLLPEQKTRLRESLAYIQSNHRQFIKMLKGHPASSWLAISDTSTFQDIAEQEALYNTILRVAHSAGRYFKYSDRTRLLRELDSYNVSPGEITEALDAYIEQIATLKSKLFGFSGRMLVVENLNKQLVKSLPSFGLPDPEKQTESMQVMSDFVRYTTHELAASGLKTQYWKNVVQIMLADDLKLDEIQDVINSLNQTARYDFARSFKLQEADNLLANITLLENATELNRSYKEFPKIGKLFGITTINHLLARPHEFSARASKLLRNLNEANELNEAKQSINGFIEQYPEASKRLGVIYKNGNFEVVDDTFTNSDSDFIKEYIAYKKKERDIREYFNEVAIDSYSNDSIEYQQILGVELQHMLNKNFLQFTQQHGAYVNLLQALKDQRKLTPAEAANLIKSFPCVTSEIHEVSSRLPLEAELFDLAIVDTADSISIAETLPIVLRAKKVLVIGDSAQSTPADIPVSSTASELHTTQLAAALRDQLADKPADSKNSILAKQEATFVASQSALQFFAAFANYDTTLKKQYGVYDEIASFGNKYYYGDSPISLTSRAVPLSDLFTFSHVKPTKGQVSRFTNSAEVDHIIEHLHKLKESGFSGTIGIVTPFAEQAALLQKELDECVITDWFERRDLRVMTFDSRRQRERDYTYYSFVASTMFNELSQALPSAIGFDAFLGDTRSHRLLRGLNGNRHSIHIVHSLPASEYGGSLSELLKHYSAKLQGPSVKIKGASTDMLLPAESNISQAFDKTMFAKKYKERLSFLAKYQFTDYIKPLSPNHHKAQYKVFFLVVVDDRPIVIEFDDFKERFLQNGKHEKDSGAYLTAQDIYGYKLLEGYGYRFLRLNKFTLGSDPVRALDSYLGELMKTPSWPSDNGFVV